MKRSRGSSLDIISNLPNHVIESILAYLPIRDAVRTSILSTKWKDKWVTLPHLIFNENTFTSASVDPDPQATVMIDEGEIIKVISQVLLQHRGLILKFVLSIRPLRSCPTINQWLSYLSGNGIEDLTLEILSPQSHVIPSSFFSCQHLRHLKIFNCIVKPPPAFSGFKKLRSVDFTRVSCSAKSLENIISNNPLLEKLTLFHMLDLHSLTINAPNLVYLMFIGESESLCNINAPRLLKLILHCNYQRSGISNNGEGNRSSNLFNLIGCLPGTIELLHLNGYTSQFFEVGNILKNLPNTLSRLSVLILETFSFEKLDSVACALCLIRNTPNLMMIEMDVEKSEDPSANVEQVLTLMKSNLGLSVNLKKLLSFKVTSIGGKKPEMEFIKFILATSPVLVEVHITADRAHPSYNVFTTLKELISFTRASSSAAKIFFSDGDKDLIF